MKTFKRTLSMLLIVAMLLSCIPAVAVSAAGNAGTTTIQDLEIDQRTNPMGVDNTVPEFRWEMVSDVRGQKQTAYQIVVKDDEEIVWNTGKVESDASNAIPYEGAALETGVRYTWNVTVWDKDGNELTPAEDAWFEMGLLNESDWDGADFIAPSVEVSETPAPTNYSIEFDFKVGKDCAGFVFGGKDGSHFMMWQVNTFDYTTANSDYKGTENKVYFRPHVWNGGAACVAEIDISNIIPWDKAFDAHTMKIEVKGTTVYTYIDGVKLDWTYSHDVATFGMIGSRHNDSSKVDEYGIFDNIKITDDDSGEVLYVNDFSEHKKPFTAGEIKDGWLHEDRTEVQMGDPMTASLGTSAPMFRKEFEVKEGLASARLYTTSLGIYEAFINGEKVGTDKMAPGWTDYYEYVQYQTHDVTDMLTAGTNAMGAIVGNGWYSGHVSTYGRVNIYGTDEAFLSQLVLTYDDGTVETIGTDDTWQSFTDGPYVDTCNQNGETYDANKEIPGWNEPGLDTADWTGTKVATKANIKTNVDPQAIALVAQPEEPATVIEELPVKFLAQTDEDTYVYDIGQNIAGILRLRVEGEAGTTLKLRHGEMVYKDTNKLYTANLREAKATDYYTLKGTEGGEVYEPAFTFHGFRYFEVSGLGYRPAEEDITALVVHSQLDRTGYIETNNELINKLYSNVIWSNRDNYLSVPTDCPQRDERLGWTGDATIFSRTASINFDINAFYTKYMRDVEAARNRENGSIYDIAPAEGHPVGTGNSVWGDVAIVGPWTMFTAYGDTAILEENWDMMTDWIGYYENIKAGDDFLMEGDTYGDWLAIGESTPAAYVSSAYYAYVTGLMVKMADALGKTEEAAYYTNLYNNIVAAFNERYVNNANGKLKGADTQTGYCLALCFDLITDPEARKMAGDNLVARIQAKDWHLSGGFVGIEYLLPALTKVGYTDVAYQLLLTETYPSWLYSVVNGATTMWERWNSYIAETGTFGDVSMNSFNHYSFGAVAEWMYQDAAGIRYDVENPGYKHFSIAPHPSRTLNEFKAEYESVYGRIVSDWTLVDGVFTLNAKVPANTTATIVVPSDDAAKLTVDGKAFTEAVEGVTYVGTENGEATFEVVSGEYTFVSAIKDRYTVTASVDSSVEGGTFANITVNGEAGRASVVSGEEVTLEAQSVNPAEWAFVAWTGDVESTENPLKITVTDDVKVAATFRYVGRSNLASGCKVTVSSNDGGAPSWSASNLVDGLYTHKGNVNGWTSGGINKDNCNVTVQVDLGAETAFNTVHLYPRTDSLTAAGGTASFPRDFTIQVSDNGSDWTTVATVVDAEIPAPGVPCVVEFDTVTARYVKMNATKAYERPGDDTVDRIQLAEFGVYNTTEVAETYTLDIAGNGKVLVNGEEVQLPYAGSFAAASDVTVEAVSTKTNLFQKWTGSVNGSNAKISLYMGENKTLTAHFGTPAETNLALHKPVSANTTLNSGSSWGAGLLTDGDTITGTGYSNNNDKHIDTQDPTLDVKIDINLGAASLMDKVLIYPRNTPNEPTPDGKVSSYPRDFELQVSDDGQNWTTVKTVVDERTPEWGETMVYELDEPVSGKFFRLHATKAGLVETSDKYYRVQLRELEIYNENFVEDVTFTSDAKVAPGAELQTVLAAVLADGSNFDLTGKGFEIAYASSDEKVAAVDENGVVTGVSEGEAVISATVNVNGIVYTAEQTVSVSYSIVDVELVVTGADKITVDADTVSFTVSAKDAVDLATATVELALTGELAEPELKPADGWYVIGQVVTDGKLKVVLGNNAGVTAASADLFTVTCKTTGKTGDATVSITAAKLAAYVGEGEMYVNVILGEDASATTKVDYSVYDVNQDGIVNQLDLTRAQRHYGTDHEICDVNGDGIVDIADLILILNNYTVAF